MSCKPECMKTASLSVDGHRIMISEPGNKKFPISHTPHPQCESCEKESVAEALAQIAKAFPDDALFKKFDGLKKKLGR